jgi:alkylation response protein AidB-like acyl-CoA dehydrogenase
MHNVFRLPDKRQRVVDHLPTEIEAVAATRSVAAQIADIGKEAGQGRSRLFKQLDAVSRAGLFGISVPSDYGGADITNAVLAEIVALLAERDRCIGESVKSHFHVLEAIRLFASQGQHGVYFSHALAGEHFALGLPVNQDAQAESQAPALVADRTGFCLHAPTVALRNGFCDWIAVPALDPKGQQALALLARDLQHRTEKWEPVFEKIRCENKNLEHRADSDFRNDALDELTFRQVQRPVADDDGAAVWLNLSDVHVSADNLIAIASGVEALSTLSSLATLLDSAVRLGSARASFQQLCQRLHALHAEEAVSMVGRLAARLEGAVAMIERAGQRLDVAQINPTPDSAQQASLAAYAAAVLTAEIAMETRAKLADVQNNHTGQDAETRLANMSRDNQSALGQFHLFGEMPLARPFL